MIERPWMIKSWPVYEWYLPAAVAEWPKFAHIATNVLDSDLDAALPDGSRMHGDTVWGCEIDGISVGLGWEWAEERPGVVVLRDPNTIVSNLCFVTSGRTYAEPLDTVVYLNRVVHFLAWQQSVRDAIGSALDALSVTRRIDARPKVSRRLSRSQTAAIATAA